MIFKGKQPKNWCEDNKQWVKLVLVAFFAFIVALAVLSIPNDKYCVINSDNANKSSFLGYIAGIISITIAFLIYKFQTVDTKKSLRKLEHMAFLMQEVDISTVEKKIAEIIEKKPTHIFWVSRYSAMPGFWINLHNTFINKIKTVEKVKLLLIGPTEKALAFYATDYADKTITKKPEKDEIITRYDNSFANTSPDNNKVNLKNARRDLIKEDAPIGVNALIFKNTKTNILSDSKYDVLFFGEPDNIDQSKPMVSQNVRIYYAPVSLIAKMWKYELGQILSADSNSNKNEDIKWLKQFFDEED